MWMHERQAAPRNMAPGSSMTGATVERQDDGEQRDLARRQGFVWLASYPKSGNTWLRMLLANLLIDSRKGVPLNGRPFRLAFGGGTRFEDLTGMAAGDCIGDETDRLIPELFRLDFAARKASLGPHLYRKVHSAYVANRCGQALFPNDVTAGAVYIVRNPLDVAVSCAFHNGWSSARSVPYLNDTRSTVGGPNLRSCRERLLDWSGNVQSWSDAPFPVLVLRYEDMLSDTVEQLRRVAHFLRMEDVSEARLRHAAAHSSFARLRRIEERKGFVEKPEKNAGRFFREGRAGGWREHLSAAEARQLVRRHWATMELFGYDPEGALADVDAREAASGQTSRQERLNRTEACRVT